MTYRPNETVYCRFTREALVVVSCDGAAVVTVRDASGDISHRAVGVITRRTPGA